MRNKERNKEREVKMNVLEFIEKTEKEVIVIKNRLGSLRTPDVCGEGVLRLWDEGKLLSLDWERNRMWLNVVSHMTTVAFLAERLGLALAAGGVALNIPGVVQAALVHDWEKRLEFDARDISKGDGSDEMAEAIRTEEEGYRLVGKILGEKVATYIGAAGGHGIERCDAGRMSWEEKLMFYSDYCASGSTIVTLKGRFDALEQHYAKGGMYESVDVRAQQLWGMREREKLALCLNPIAHQICEVLSIRNEENLPLIVTQ